MGAEPAAGPRTGPRAGLRAGPPRGGRAGPSTGLLCGRLASLLAVLFFLLSLLLGGCASAPRRPAALPELPAGRAALWEAHRREVAALAHWSLEGRFALVVRAGLGRRGWQGRLSWREGPRRRHLVLADPAGLGLLRLDAGPGGAVLEGPQGRREGPDGGALLAEALGRPLPLEALAAWLRGLPGPGPHRVLAVDAQGRLRALRQGPWRVQVLRYRPAGGLSLPALLAVEGRGLRLRLAVHRWVVG